MDVLFRLTLSTGIGLTVTVQAAVLPLVVSAVMTAVPSLIAVTVPLETVATVVSLEDHLTALLVAFVGLMVAVSVSFAPI